MTQLLIDDWVARKAEGEVKRLRAAGWVDLTAAVGYQRRHRKWALKNGRRHLLQFHVQIDSFLRVNRNLSKAVADLSRQRRLRKRSIDFARFYNMKRQMAEDEAKELWGVFYMYETRMGEATKLWQQATGEHDTLPDLGVLLDWLMGEIERLEKENIAGSKGWEDSIDRWTKVCGKIEADKAKLVEAADKIVCWYDGECLFAETIEIFEQIRAVLKEVE